MKIILQRVLQANLKIDDKLIAEINKGIVVFIGVVKEDTILEIPKQADKICNLRIFNDNNQKMNQSLMDINGDILIISQFTLYANCKKGNRPSFINVAPPEHAKKIYNEFVNYMNNKTIKVQTGQFGADMQVSLINDGPATFILETHA